MASITRVYHPEAISGFISGKTELQLSDDAAGHVGRVLRMRMGDTLQVFDGQGGCYSAEISLLEKRKVCVRLHEQIEATNESPLQIHLGQGISRGEKMDFTIQKAVELGVQEITPLITERCGVKLKGDRWDKKWQHWQKVIISACEQCGRNTLPVLHPVTPLAEWLAQDTAALKLNLHPRAEHTIKTLPAPAHGVRLVIGPEGGLSDTEIDQASSQEFTELLMGPRILRTETAALTIITALQVQFGDFA